MVLTPHKLYIFRRSIDFLGENHMSLYEHAKKAAEAILMGQEVAKSVQPAPPPQQIELKEVPKALSYYYSPHHYLAVSPNEHETIYEFEVPPNHVFHIQLVGNNFFYGTYSIWEVDGVIMGERIERVLGSVNSALNISGWRLAARNNVRWTTYNESKDEIISEVVLDGVVYLAADWEQLSKLVW